MKRRTSQREGKTDIEDAIVAVVRIPKKDATNADDHHIHDLEAHDDEMIRERVDTDDVTVLARIDIADTMVLARTDTEGDEMIETMVILRNIVLEDVMTLRKSTVGESATAMIDTTLDETTIDSAMLLIRKNAHEMVGLTTNALSVVVAMATLDTQDEAMEITEIQDSTAALSQVHLKRMKRPRRRNVNVNLRQCNQRLVNSTMIE